MTTEKDTRNYKKLYYDLLAKQMLAIQDDKYFYMVERQELKDKAIVLFLTGLGFGIIIGNILTHLCA
jgi:hypothetical protein